MLNLNLINSGSHGSQTFFEDTATTEAVTAVATGGTANVAGAWVELVASADFDANCLDLIFRVAGVANREGICLQIGIGTSGLEEAVTDWLSLANMPSRTFSYKIPLNVAAGERVSARVIGNTYDRLDIAASRLTSNRELAGLVSENLMADQTNYYDCVALDPGGTANTKGVYSEIIASTLRDLKYIDISFASNSGRSASAASWLFDIALGASGVEVVYIPNIYTRAQAYDNVPFPRMLRIPVNIPAGNRISMRAQSDFITVTTRDLLVSLAGWGY